MTNQGTSAKINCIQIGVYLAIPIIHIKESVKFWARGVVQALYEGKKHPRSDSPRGWGSGGQGLFFTFFFGDGTPKHR